jgi:hypothetical protein
MFGVLQESRAFFGLGLSDANHGLKQERENYNQTNDRNRRNAEEDGSCTAPPFSAVRTARS